MNSSVRSLALGKGLQSHWQKGDRACALPFISCGQCSACVTGRPFECATLSCIGIDAPGGFADYVATSECNTLKLPDELSTLDAALIEPLAVALHAVRAGDLKAGQRVLVTGAGPIGLAVAMWARFIGARDVVVSEPAPERRALALGMGATAVVQPGETLAEQFADIAGGPPEVLFECVGAPGLLQQCIDIAPRRAMLVPVGVCEQPDTILPFSALIKELSIRFAIAYNRGDYETVISMLAQGRIDASPMVTGVVSLEDMPGAFEALRTPSDQCKILTRIK